MRKKRHLRVHPKNPRYDRFYVVNYTQAGFAPSRVSEAISRNQIEANDEEDETWEDWIDDEVDRVKTLCLFCDDVSNGVSSCLTHMANEHLFDLTTLRHSPGSKKGVTNISSLPFAEHAF